MKQSIKSSPRAPFQGTTADSHAGLRLCGLARRVEGVERIGEQTPGLQRSRANRRLLRHVLQNIESV